METSLNTEHLMPVHWSPPGWSPPGWSPPRPRLNSPGREGKFSVSKQGTEAIAFPLRRDFLLQLRLTSSEQTLQTCPTPPHPDLAQI